MIDGRANGRISLQSKFLSIDGAEVDELARLCGENSIEFQNILFRTDSVSFQASALWSWFTLAFSPDVINTFTQGLLASGAYDFIKWSVIKVVKALRSRTPLDSKSDKSTIIELKSASAYLKIESDKVPDQTFSEAFDTFVKVSSVIQTEERPVIPIYVVINGDNNVDIMKQNDYIWKYVARKESDGGDESHGQP